MNVSPKLAGFLKGLVLSVIAAIAVYLSDATNIAFISNPLVVAIIVSLASSIESSMKANSDGTKGLFGAVSIKKW